ncbi:Shikimate kinase [Frankliniella fusca]|uniref:Shikimate kinase n=1 Tax=Frankliniella fusca TaxID=407009 RepID=A0AAE1HHA0_9NEOP|nr:Shikimate kinase [Frankliniella fusca]
MPILCKTSHPSVVSNRTGSVVSADSAVSYITLPCGLQIKAAFEHRFKSCNSPKDFESVLLHACFDNPEEMRMRSGSNNKTKFNSDWLAKAGAYYSEWLDKREEISPAERIRLVTGLGSSLSKSNRNKSCRGVNLAMRTAREEGRCPKEAKETYIAEQAALQAAGSKRKAGGGRPKSTKRSSASATSSVTGSGSVGALELDEFETAAGPSNASFHGLDEEEIGPGPQGPSAHQWRCYLKD